MNSTFLNLGMELTELKILQHNSIPPSIATEACIIQSCCSTTPGLYAPVSYIILLAEDKLSFVGLPHMEGHISQGHNTPGYCHVYCTVLQRLQDMRMSWPGSLFSTLHIQLLRCRAVIGRIEAKLQDLIQPGQST